MSPSIIDMFGPRRQPKGVGVEIEVEGVNLPMVVAGWDPHRDGSLRGESMEYVTVGAVSLDELAKRMDVLKAAFDANQGKANDAHRASVHVHVNVQSKTAEQIVGILALWMVLESFWMHFCGPTRENNLFCTSSASQGDIPVYCRRFFKMVKEGSYHRPPERFKYQALNTNPLTTQGSLEFRTFPSTIDKDKIVKWAKWCYSVVEVGSQIDIEKLDSFLSETIANPMALLEKIFDKDTIAQNSIETVYPYIEAGVEAASELIFVIADSKRQAKKSSLYERMREEQLAQLRPDFFNVDPPLGEAPAPHMNQFFFNAPPIRRPR